MSAYWFDIRPTKAYAGLIVHRIVGSPLSYVLYALVCGPLLLWSIGAGYLPQIGTMVLLLVFGLHVERLFTAQKLRRDEEKVINKKNLGCYVTFDIIKHIRSRGHITLPKLLKSATATKRGKFILSQLGIDRAAFLKKTYPSLKAEKADVMPFVLEAFEAAKDIGEKRVDANAILSAFFHRKGSFLDVLNASDVSLQDMDQILKWEAFHHGVSHRYGVLHPHRLVRSLGSVGRGWVQGYTHDLDRLVEDISGSVRWRVENRGIQVHQKQLDNAVQVLSRSSQRNTLFVGTPGVGKHTMVENVSYRIRQGERKNGKRLTRVLMLQIEELLSGETSGGQNFLKALKKAEKAGSMIIIIENMAALMRASDESVRTILSKFLKSPSIAVFGLISPEDYHGTVKADPVLDDLFEKIYIEDTDDEETTAVLMAEYFDLQSKYRVTVTYRAMKMLIELTRRYVGRGGMPGNAVDVLRDAVLIARDAGERIVVEEHIRKAISLKAHMDVSEVSDNEKEKLLRLEQILKASIVGQDAAVDALVNSLKRARLDIGAGKRPLGTFLFLGPTGVGKTHTAKIMAKEYFGTVDALIRIDMNDYGTEESVYGIIGDPNPKESTESFLSKQVQDRPFSVILLDEIEKAHKKVLNLFLQILDEGHLTDARGVTTDFRNTIIIATSNAGALFIRDFFKDGGGDRDAFRENLIDHILNGGQFAPEFLNRFDDTLVYYPMSVQDAVKVALLMLDDIVLEIADQKGYHIHVDQDVIVEVVKAGYSIEFGARAMRRTIVDMIQNFLADYLLRNNVKRGDTIQITAEDVRS